MVVKLAEQSVVRAVWTVLAQRKGFHQVEHSLQICIVPDPDRQGLQCEGVSEATDGMVMHRTAVKTVSGFHVLDDVGGFVWGGAGWERVISVDDRCRRG